MKNIASFPIDQINIDDSPGEPYDVDIVRHVLKTRQLKGSGLSLRDLNSFDFLMSEPKTNWLPIVLNENYEVLDGFHRFAIAVIKKYKTVYVLILSPVEEQQFEMG